ncbi:hypothetical protein STSO111631_23075 [Stackebrandtia soli]
MLWEVVIGTVIRYDTDVLQGVLCLELAGAQFPLQ